MDIQTLQTLGLIQNYVFLACIIMFIIGLKKLSSPDSARKGNQLAAAAMIISILVAMFWPMEGAVDGVNLAYIIAGLAIGGAIGLLVAKRIAMTAMPEMVSLFNGLGGAATTIVALSEFLNFMTNTPEASPLNGSLVTTAFALFIGGISFTGSLIAYGKLNGSLRDNLRLPAPQIVNLLMLLGTLGLAAYTLMQPTLELPLVLIFLGMSLVYGITFVIPIGGGDMPVVISLLNSFTGIGAALAGIIYDNNVMLFGGILVGASGIILTVLMCKAMNRSLFNVIVGGFGTAAAAAGAAGDQGTAKEATVSDTAIMLKYASKVIVVPGYGLAVAQAQHTVHELEKKLEEEGVDFKYAIHPVAGRMPGHMNVLLAEADVPYPKLLEMDDANSEFSSTDVVLVVGANDVVNPAAKDDPSSPIFGMPILDVQLAKNVIVLKRSMKPGYAGIENQLFFGDKTRMLFGDAKGSIQKLSQEIANS